MQAVPVQSMGEMPGQTMPNPGQKKKKAAPILIAVGVIALVVLLLSLFGGSDPVDFVKNGKLNAYPEQTVGEAFGDFFSDPEWTSYEDDGDTYVKFTGGCLYDGEEVDVKMIFEIDDEEFEIVSAKVEGVDMTYYEMESLLDTIYE